MGCFISSVHLLEFIGGWIQFWLRGLWFQQAAHPQDSLMPRHWFHVITRELHLQDLAMLLEDCQLGGRLILGRIISLCAITTQYGRIVLPVLCAIGAFRDQWMAKSGWNYGPIVMTKHCVRQGSMHHGLSLVLKHYYRLDSSECSFWALLPVFQHNGTSHSVT